VAAAVKAALRVTHRIPAAAMTRDVGALLAWARTSDRWTWTDRIEIDLETERVFLDADGVQVEIATSVSHPGYVIVVITDTTGEDQIWRIPTRATLAREFLGDRS
jgi:hypothetical protein